MRNILLRTTFKDDLFLLKPIYNFYKDIWDPETYVFYVGYTKDEGPMIQDINTCLGINIEFQTDTNDRQPYIRSSKVYKYNNLYFNLYKTDANTDATTWDCMMRQFLYKNGRGLPDSKDYKYFLNIDNDDFFYVKDVDHALTQDILRAHTFEFMSHERFDLSADLMFISSSYYYRLKGAKNKSVTIENSHGWCRALYLKDPFRNETHAGKSAACYQYDSLRDISFNELDTVCFAFGCIDLQYLLTSKCWLQSEDKDTSRFKYGADKIKDDFYKYYTLTDAERAANILVECNALKRYF